MGESGLRVITTATRAELRAVTPRNPVYRLARRRFIRVVRVSG
ncbi:hypothetical protein [Actinospica robiniae]|nr:hypothetical protein [Actinospica robiniae]